MSLFIVIFSFTGGFMYAIEPASQDYCKQEAQEILAKFIERDKTNKYYGGCVWGGMLINVKRSDA